MGHFYACDRCGSRITKTLYRVNITAAPVADGFTTTEAASFNLAEAMQPQKHFCKDCLKVIQDAMKGG